MMSSETVSVTTVRVLLGIASVTSVAVSSEMALAMSDGDGVLTM